MWQDYPTRRLQTCDLGLHGVETTGGSRLQSRIGGLRVSNPSADLFSIFLTVGLGRHLSVAGATAGECHCFERQQGDSEICEPVARIQTLGSFDIPIHGLQYNHEISAHMRNAGS